MNSAGGNVKLLVKPKIVNGKNPNKIMIVQSKGCNKWYCSYVYIYSTLKAVFLRTKVTVT